MYCKKLLSVSLHRLYGMDYLLPHEERNWSEFERILQILRTESK